MNITVEQLKASEDQWIKLRDAKDPAAADAERQYQELARRQTEQLQTTFMQSQISRFLK
jgi:hypothetical protein